MQKFVTNSSLASVSLTRPWQKRCKNILKEHLCSHHQHYLERGPEYYIRRASNADCPAFYQLVKLNFEQNRHPEQLYNTCDCLLSLYRKNDKDFEQACQIAIDYEQYAYQFIKNILENNMTRVQEPEREE